MKIVYLAADSKEEWNSSFWRMEIPYYAINRSGSPMHSATMFHLTDFANSSGSVVQACEDADVLVVQRNTFGPVLAAMDYWIMKGKAIVMDFDDAFQMMHNTNVSYEFWAEGIVRGKDKDGKDTYEKISPPPIMQMRQGVRKAHLLTTPSRRLCIDWAKDNPNSVFLPNYMDLTLYPPTPKPNDGIIRIGWGGSLGHPQSIRSSGVLEAVADVCRMRKHVKMMVCGSDTRIKNAFGFKLSDDAMINQPWVPMREWYKVLYQYAIAIAPLSGGYDDRRSGIKLFEAMYTKTPWVASKGNTYKEYGKYGTLVDNMIVNWKRALLEVVDNYPKYLEYAQGEPYDYACSLSADLHIQDYIDTYTLALKERDRRGNKTPTS